MSRELKFRVWSYLSKSFEYFDIYQGANLGIAGGVSEPQQFTGMLDKNGKEIYEGDLIECPQYVKSESFSNPLIVTGEVKWDDKEGCWSAYPACSETNYNLYKANSEKIEIVGNIFEK